MNPRPLGAFWTFLSTLAAAAAFSCPESQYQKFPGAQLVPVTTPTASFDTSSCGAFGCTAERLAFDIPNATFRVSASASGVSSGQSVVSITDDFSATGFPSGSQAFLYLDLDLTAGFSSPNAGGHVTVVTPGSTPLDLGVTAGESHSLAVVGMTAGQPVRITISVGVDGQASSASIAGRFSFFDLPPGVVVTSCNGYSSDRAVTNRATSWGRLKTLYRR